MTEWLKVAVLKTAVPSGTGGSNPSSSVVKTSLPIKDSGVFFLPISPSNNDLSASAVCLPFTGADCLPVPTASKLLQAE